MADLTAENTASEGLPDCPFCGGELCAVVLAADVGGGPGVSCLIVECRNSLPAVLDCIAALVRCCDETDYCYVCDNHPSHGHAKDCSLAVFVSGQEEPSEGGAG
jgi:hypothetical protein